MYRLPPATDRRLPGPPPTALSAGLLALLIAVLPLPARAESQLPRLHAVEIGGTEHPPEASAFLGPGFARKSYEDLTILAIPQPVFHLTFVEDESFRFILPVSILYDSQVFGSLGATEYSYTLTWADGSTVEATIPVPNKLLRIRAALLAAEGYWREAAGRSGHSFELLAPDEPIDINIGYFVDENEAAYAKYFRQEIRIRQDLDDFKLETTPIHELFHILTHAIIQTAQGNPSDYFIWMAGNRDIARLLFESTAEWSEDEPVRVPAGAGGIPGRDIDTDYASDCPPPYVESGTDLFRRSPYCVSWLIKYYVEQIAGGSDTARPEAVLGLIARAASRDRLTMDNFFWALAEGLPADRFPGATWQERWQRFYTSFAAAVLVRRPSVAGGPGSQIAFHDDEFAGETSSPFFPMRSHRRDYLRAPDQIYATPAASDAERAERLATIARRVELAPFAYFYNVLELNVLMGVFETQNLDSEVPRQVEARSVFVYASGPEGTNAFLLRQQVPDYWDWEHRNFGSFERVNAFSLVGSDGTVVREQMGIPASGPDNTYLNLGFVNPGPASAPREISWAYLASPRLIPTPTRSRGFEFQPIAPVRLVGGSGYSAYDAGRRDQFENGDSFVFEVTTTGKLHLGADSREDIPKDERTIDLAIVCGGDGKPVLLAEEDGQAIRVAASPSPREGPDGRFFYLFSGQVDPDNSVTGDCRIRVELTSLLNLGGTDRQVDESFSVRVGDPLPEVSRLQVTSEGAVVYDSQDNRRLGVEPAGGTEIRLPDGTVLPTTGFGDGAYTLGLRVWFSTPLSSGDASINAGFAPPYDAYEVPADPAFSGVARWSTWSDPDDRSDAGENALLETEFIVPEMDALFGGLLWFSISAISPTGMVLDSDPATPGDQRDTRHFALLSLEDYFLATLSVESRWDGSVGDDDEQSTWDVVYRPLEAQFRAVPVGAARGSDIVSGERAASQMLILWQRMLQSFSVAGEEEQAILRDLDVEFRVLVRLLEGARVYNGCDEYLGLGPVPVRFGGMHSTFDYRRWGTNTREGTVVHTATAPAWRSDDADFLGNGFCPTIEVWDYDPGDLEIARELAVSPPTSRLPADFGGEQLLPASLISSFRNYERLPGLTHLWSEEGLQRASELTGLVAARQAFGQVFDDALALVTIVAWRFAPTDEFGRVERIDLSGNVMFADETPSLPALPEGPLMRVIFEPEAVWPFPLDGRYHRTDRFEATADGPLYEDIIDGEFQAPRLHETLNFGEYGNSYNVAEWPVVPSLSPGGVDSFLWAPEPGTEMQVTNRTVPWHLFGENPFLVITGRMEDGRLVGGVVGQAQTCITPYNDNPDFCEVQYRWSIERNAVPGGPSPWPQAQENARLPDPSSEDDDENGIRDPDDEDTTDDTTDEDTGDASDVDPPGGPTLEPARSVAGWPAPGAPTMQYSGVVQGVIFNGSERYEPGHVAVYLTGEGLPPRDGEPLQMELNQGFRQSVIAVPVGGAIRFHNGEGATGPTYNLQSDSDLAAFHHVLAPGDEAVANFLEEGRLTLRVGNLTGDMMDVLVLPSTRFALLETNSYIIRDVPPGRYMLRAVIENRRYQPLATPVEVTETGRATVDVTLVERGGVASAGLR